MSLSEKKKKSRYLEEIEVDEITLCKSPASRKKFYIKKQDERDQLSSAIDEFMRDSINTEEDVDELIEGNGVTEIIKALNAIKEMKSDTPDNMEESLETLAIAIKKMIPREEVVKASAKLVEAKGEEKENKDNWLSISLPADIQLRTIKKAEPAIEEEGEEECDEFDDDPQISLLRSIEKQLLDKKEPTDPFPSVYIPTFRKADEPEPLPAKKVDPNAKEIPQKKSIESQGDEDVIIVEKEEDLFPSIFDASVYRNK